MFQVYHLPRDLKRHLTYFSWSPRAYDDLRHTVIQFDGITHQPFPESDAAPPDTPSSTWTPSAPWPVQTVALPTTGYTGDGDHPPAPIDPSTVRPTILESTSPASDVPVLPPEPLPPLSITDSTSTTAPCTVAFAAESCAAPLTAQGNSAITDEPADVAAEQTHVLISVQARDTAYTTVAEPAFALHAGGFANTLAPAAQALVDCQPNPDLSFNALNGSQSFLDVPARISSDLSEEPHPTPSCLSTTQAPSGVLDSHFSLPPSCCHYFRGDCTRFMHSARLVLRPEHTSRCRQALHEMVGFGSTRAFAPLPSPAPSTHLSALFAADGDAQSSRSSPTAWFPVRPAGITGLLTPSTLTTPIS
ncbi:hypothetical protein HPB52_021316 [Rhipicephalus sanguineus]|uniref:Uncharacterized protein n=1 Tax=Rhipicephalus sanguineus TaxID=34632 RepID=A0A9D4PCM8_RHISA|nr:hypothetical protein HPB52_021316 [Rhipicephalus sanguineus]